MDSPFVRAGHSRTGRQQLLAHIIETHSVHSQQDLVRVLDLEYGLRITQATISRDLEALGATKVRSEAGHLRYTVAEPRQEYDTDVDVPLHRLVVSAAAVGNMAVLHTSRGAGGYVASRLERAPIEGIMGTVADNDTVLVIVDTVSHGRRLVSAVTDVLPNGG